MKELGARLRVEGLSDVEAAALTVPLDGAWLADREISTWRTDAGDFDVPCNMPARDGTRKLTKTSSSGPNRKRFITRW